MLFTKWGQSNNQNLTDGRTDRQTEIINLIVGLATRNPPKNDKEKVVIFAAALRLSFDACSVKALIHYDACRFIFVVRIIRVAYSGNAPSIVNHEKPHKTCIVSQK